MFKHDLKLKFSLPVFAVKEHFLGFVANFCRKINSLSLKRELKLFSNDTKLESDCVLCSVCWT